MAELQVHERMTLDDALGVVLSLAREAADNFEDHVYDLTCETKGLDSLDPPDDIEDEFSATDSEVIEENEMALAMFEEFIERARALRAKKDKKKIGFKKK
jgi:hypothetical protein